MSTWQPIDKIPPCEPWHQPKRVLVFSPRFGVQMGRVYRYPDGEVVGAGEDFNGEWGVTHFHDLPEPPK